VGDGGDVALEPSATGGLEVVVRMRRSDVPPPRREDGRGRERQYSTTSAT
jgi:hypothetical protein